MNSLKKTSFVIFIILFIIAASLLVNEYSINEGFISYAFNKQPIDFVWIPQYSKNDQKKSVVKLYDNIYFDSKNANLIEVDANPDGSVTNVDNIGNTITDIYVTKRGGPEITTHYNINNQNKLENDSVVSANTSESLIDSISESYTSFKYDSQSKNTNSYSIFYLAWKKTTYIHIIDNSSITVPANNIGTFMFNNQGDMKKVLFSENSAIGLNTFIEDTDASNNTYIFMNEQYNPLFTKLPSYKENDTGALVFQISKYVRFDPQYGTLIILNNESGTRWTIYDRYGTVWQQNTYFDEKINSGISNVEFTSWSVVDKLGQNMVLYSAVGKNTVVSIIQYSNNDSKKYSLVNVKRFNELGTVDYNENIRNAKKGSVIETFGNSDNITTSDETRWKTISKLFWDTANNEPSPIYDEKTGRYLGDKTTIPSVCTTRSGSSASGSFASGSAVSGSSASASSASASSASRSFASGSSASGSAVSGSSASRSASSASVSSQSASSSASGSAASASSVSRSASSASVSSQYASSSASASGSSRSNGFTTLAQAYSKGDLKPNSMTDDFIIIC